MREQLQEIFSTVSRNKLRTFLTGFSVAWGIFMLIVLLGSGNGLRNAMQDNFSGRAINSMFIYSGQTSVPYKGFQSGRHIQINQRDMEILKTEFSDRIDKITASVWHNDAHISYGGEFTSATLYGVLPQTQPIDGIQIVEGRFINETDVKEKRKVVVLDDLACRVLFKDGGSPVGRMVQIDKMGYTVVGTYKGLSYSYTSQIYGPLSSVLLTYMGDKRDVASISFTVRGIDTEEQSDLFKRQLRTRLGAEHSFSPEDKSAIWINDRMESYQQTMTIFHGIALFIWIIGIGTLTAGIVGVSNIMLVTVRIRHPQGDGRQAVVARQAGPARIGTDHGGLRLRRTDRRRRGHGSGQLFHGPGRRRFAEPIFHVQESHARPVDRRQRHARTDRRRHERRLRSGSPGRTYQGDRRDEAQQINDPQPINPNRNYTPRKPCST